MPLVVEKIEEGTVIDHIEAGKGLKVLQILGVEPGYDSTVALVMNAHSKKMGRKDIVKISKRFLDEKTTNKITLISPRATICVIRNSEVEEKYMVETPKELSGIGKCPNPACITNQEEVESSFKAEKGQFRCQYCERMFKAGELV